MVDATLKLEEVALKKIEKIADLNDHWFVYKQEEVPNHIIEAKKRLGQIKEPFVIPNRAGNSSRISLNEENSTENNVSEVNQFKLQSDSKSSFGSISTIKSKNEKHWLTWENPSTPPHIKAIRGRLGDTRYKNLADLSYVRFKTLDEYNDRQSVLNAERPKTCTNATSRTAFDLTCDSDAKPRVKTATITRIVPAQNENQTIFTQESTIDMSNNNLIVNEGSMIFNDSQITGLNNEPTTTTVETNVELINSHGAQSNPSNENIVVLNNNHTNSVILNNQEKLLQRENTYNKFFKNYYTIEDNSNPVALETWISNANDQGLQTFVQYSVDSIFSFYLSIRIHKNR